MTTLSLALSLRSATISVLSLLLLVSTLVAAFQVPPRTYSVDRSHTTTTLGLFGGIESDITSLVSSLPTPISTSSSFVVAAEETWRQYVPLGVSLLVIGDILLGSPMANSVLGIVRAQEVLDGSENDGDDATTTTSRTLRNFDTKGERVDSELLASAALERARNTLNYQTERDLLKTDKDRMEDMRKAMDDQLRSFDEKQNKI